MSDVVSLDEATFYDFVAAPTPNIVFLAVHAVHPFNPALSARLEQAGVEGLRFGTVVLFELLSGRAPLLRFLAQAKAELTPHSPGAHPGYYLFAEGRLLAFDTGLPLRADLHHVLRGAALGSALYGFTRQIVQAVEVLVAAVSGPVAERIAARFASAFAAHQAEPRGPRAAGAEPNEHELAWAYQLLGVPAAASDAEVNRAWRKLRLTWHPDRAGGDRDEFERRSRISRDLNRARDLIFAHRARRAA